MTTLTQQIPATSFQFTQAEASTSWVVLHKLGLYPTVDVYVLYGGVTQKILPLSVTYDNVNQITISFSTGMTGLAVLS